MIAAVLAVGGGIALTAGTHFQSILRKLDLKNRVGRMRQRLTRWASQIPSRRVGVDGSGELSSRRGECWPVLPPEYPLTPQYRCAVSYVYHGHDWSSHQ